MVKRRISEYEQVIPSGDNCADTAPLDKVFLGFYPRLGRVSSFFGPPNRFVDARTTNPPPPNALRPAIAANQSGS